MGIMYCSAVLTETDGDDIIWATISTLTSEYHSLPSDEHLMDESLRLECIDNTVESGEIHPRLSLFSDEISAEIRESDTT